MTKRNIQLILKRVESMIKRGASRVAVIRMNKNHRVIPADLNLDMTVNERNVELVGVYDKNCTYEWLEEDIEFIG